jgi:hypothetical protein
VDKVALGQVPADSVLTIGCFCCALIKLHRTVTLLTFIGLYHVPILTKTAAIMVEGGFLFFPQSLPKKFTLILQQSVLRSRFGAGPLVHFPVVINGHTQYQYNIFKEQGISSCIGFIWLMTLTSGGCCDKYNGPSNCTMGWECLD